MSRNWIALAVLCLAGVGSAGYWLGTKQAAPAQTAAASAPTATERKVLYYRNPMGLPDTSPVPKKDEMGMDYTPVYADEQTTAAQVNISSDKVQKLGVKTEAVAPRDMARTVRAVGSLQVDERRLHTVTARFEGYIEKLLVNASGQTVARGQPLMEVYSPELVSAQVEYLIALSGRQALRNGTQDAQAGGRQLADSALQRLQNWEISEAQLQRLQREGKASRTLALPSPASGVVLEKMAVQGMRFMPGEPLFRIADLSSLWLIADVFEQDIAQVQVGQAVEVGVDAYPGTTFTGKIDFIYPTVTAETRTTKVRVVLANPKGLLRPDMYASMKLVSGPQGKVLAVPDSAVIDSGTRQVVLVQLGDGLFEPREIKLGRRGAGYVEVLEGIGEGENVVVRANFLIDAESNLKAALGGFTSAAPHEGH